MSEKEFSSYMFNIMQVQRVNALTKCVQLGKELNREIAMLTANERIADKDKIWLKYLNANAVQSLDAELQTMTEINKVVIPFVKYISSITDLLDKTILINRYSYGYPWDKIIEMTGKSERTLMRRHKKCLHEYMTLNNIK